MTQGKRSWIKGISPSVNIRVNNEKSGDTSMW